MERIMKLEPWCALVDWDRVRQTWHHTVLGWTTILCPVYCGISATSRPLHTGCRKHTFPNYDTAIVSRHCLMSPEGEIAPSTATEEWKEKSRWPWFGELGALWCCHLLEGDRFLSYPLRGPPCPGQCLLLAGTRRVSDERTND